MGYVLIVVGVPTGRRMGETHLFDAFGLEMNL